MTARIFVLLMRLLRLAVDLVLSRLADAQRKKPLPVEVADVYAPERYQKYLNYVADYKRFSLVNTGIDIAVMALMLFLFPWARLEAAFNGNVMLICIASQALLWLIDLITDVPASYYATFVIEEKYGLNRQTKRDFAKDEARSQIVDLLVTTVFILLIAFLGEHMRAWTRDFSISLAVALGIGVSIAAVIAVFAVLVGLISIWMMKKEYTFTPMEAGPLRDKIEALQEGAKKRVRRISVYDESKKSTTKNAFLLKFLWFREFGIADNFINENAEDELLAVLSHEVGHLKHRKNLLNYVSYLFLAASFVCMVWLIHSPGLILNIAQWTRVSFGLAVNNYVLLSTVLGAIVVPLSKLITLFNNYRSRSEEYEADQQAVKNGYGEALIATFKRLSSDELINVNPHPLIEFMEYDHPGMARRIRAIRTGS